ncbi:MAG: hypothetical protein QOJ15_7401 [Bradyrhizobium sp.]|nr:hypothetical protein [Bradyrhizobium sp.]
MPQSQRLSSVIPFVTIERPACPKCKAAMMLASIEPARAGLDLHTFECAICNHELKTLAATSKFTITLGVAVPRSTPSRAHPARADDSASLPDLHKAN